MLLVFLDLDLEEAVQNKKATGSDAIRTKLHKLEDQKRMKITGIHPKVVLLENFLRLSAKTRHARKIGHVLTVAQSRLGILLRGVSVSMTTYGFSLARFEDEVFPINQSNSGQSHGWSFGF